MNENLYPFVTCPYCSIGSGTYQINMSALRQLASSKGRKRGIELGPENHEGAFSFGCEPSEPHPCEHVFHMEVFIYRGVLRSNGSMKAEWDATFRHQHPSILELDADDIGRNFLFENLYMQTGPMKELHYRPQTPHVITGWAEHRWRDECRNGRYAYMDLQSHAFFAEDVRAFLVELRQLSDREQELYAAGTRA
jgi:hypothetical protein